MRRTDLKISVTAAAAALTLPILHGGAGAAAAPFELFSAAEATHWNARDSVDPDAASATRDLRAPGAPPDCHDGKPKEAPDGPRINIVQPSAGAQLNPPVDIDLQFVAAKDAQIRPDTFRVCYIGFITVDITKRITSRVEVSADGIRVSGAQLPSGHHHLVMLIQDNRGNIGRAEAQMDVK